MRARRGRTYGPPVALLPYSPRGHPRAHPAPTLRTHALAARRPRPPARAARRPRLGPPPLAPRLARAQRGPRSPWPHLALRPAPVSPALLRIQPRPNPRPQRDARPRPLLLPRRITSARACTPLFSAAGRRLRPGHEACRSGHSQRGAPLLSPLGLAVPLSRALPLLHLCCPAARSARPHRLRLVAPRPPVALAPPRQATPAPPWHAAAAPSRRPSAPVRPPPSS